MGWVSLQNTTPDSFSAFRLINYGLGASLTLYVNPADIVVAQISLTKTPVSGSVTAFIYGITLQNGDFIDFSHTEPCDVEWAWTESVLFVLGLENYPGNAWALATVTTYRT